MSLRNVFRVGDRVRPSRRGLDAGLWVGPPPVGGVVSGNSRRAECVSVRWDGRKTSCPYHKDFISHALATPAALVPKEEDK